MNVAHFIELCRFFSSNGYSQLKIMGGEPTIHNDFLEFVEIAQRYFDSINIFTNAINDQLTCIEPRSEDAIIYNFKFSKFLTKEKLLLSSPGDRALEVQITSHIHQERLLSEIKRIVSLAPDRIKVYLTLDCTSEIFKERDIVIPIYEYIMQEAIKSNIIVGQDHLIPFCYLQGTNIPTAKCGAVCTLSCAGLIDSKYNIRFCNQFSDILGNIFQGDSTITFEQYNKLLIERFTEIHSKLRNGHCSACPYWNVICNGGCFMGRINDFPEKGVRI